MLNSADHSFLQSLEAQLPAGTLKTPEPRFLEEPRGRYKGQAAAIALPRAVDDVATVVKACHDAKVGLVPYGGGTGLVGGQIMTEGPLPLVLSLERMNTVREVYPLENVIVAEGGAILQDIQEAAAAKDRLFPLSLASHGSCRIGGNLATNAGGLNVLRYGNARDLCLGMEAVLPTGEIWNGLTRLRKDNTGYDLRNLLIGSEGSLGVITAAALKLYPKPARNGTAVMVVPSARAALDLMALVRDEVGEMVSGFELIHRQGLDFLRETMPEVRQAFKDVPEWSVLIDLGFSALGDPDEALAAIFQKASDRGYVSDGVIAQSEGQAQNLWAIRESIPLANKKIGSIVSNDVSVPISRIPEFIDEGFETIAKLGPLRVNCFGHLGDGNLHFNVFPPQGEKREGYNHLIPQVKQAVHDLVHAYEGSFSAEHGVGRMKTGDMRRYADPAKRAAMKAIKDALDPNGIMNPGAVIDW